ncbi:hypothetical protein K450DRAFT_233009 [Umbelopsis ramanniana AG]|uniref:Uncharacterized protein n=1 Tax=Umbelopsis ramanniana AG TaxID=1314678 RepID=A0AAD5EEF6_UMBRA|nr:uncharacterized protein K450DRAFT_233009 [Umbelopsis ramanniana AG]KAI8581426.1 hypothetical protein K450DRAFT_233009 [Umbelopsis ramanniana AG]
MRELRSTFQNVVAFRYTRRKWHHLKTTKVTVSLRSSSDIVYTHLLFKCFRISTAPL